MNNIPYSKLSTEFSTDNIIKKTLRDNDVFKSLNYMITIDDDAKYIGKYNIIEKLTTLSIEQALLLIKKNLKSLGINHDNFVSENSIVLNNEGDEYTMGDNHMFCFCDEHIKDRVVEALKK